MPRVIRPVALAAIAALAAGPAAAQVYGSLANFDSVNDTGREAHGFEIQIEDPLYDRSKIYSVFGLDRNFGVPPTSVERYGAPTITNLPGIGVSIRYAATFANGAWSVGTPSGPYPNAGDSCWPLGNPQYNSLTLTCDHFGVATYGSPAKVTYSWLVDNGGNSGILSPIIANVPAVNFNPLPPVAPGDPPRVEAEIEAHKHANEAFGKAFWVKVYAKHLDHNVELGNLMEKHPDVPNDNEVEAEFEIFQAGAGNQGKFAQLQLNQGDQALVLRYEFFKYLGDLSAEGEARCGRKGQKATPELCGGLGDFVGAQMAGFNQVQPPLPAVPEPSTYALMLAGLGMSWAIGRRRSRR